MASTAAAAERPADGVPQTGGVAQANGSATTPPIPTTTVEDVVVTGHNSRTSMAGGGMIAVQQTPVVRTTIGQGFIAKQLPIANTLATIRLAPGVNVGQDNPFGVSERSDLSVRGIDQTQMGFVTEGIPAGDPYSYLPDTNELIDNEDAKAITITQGTSDLASPVLSASGGLVDVQMRDPSHEMGGTLSASTSAGTATARREFGRLDTGDILATGVRSYISYSDTLADNWRGSGRSDRVHVDAKALRDWGSGSQSELFLQYTSDTDMRMSIPTLAQFQKFGPRGAGSNLVSTYSFGQTQYFQFQPFVRRIVNVGAPQTIHINDAWSLNVTPYFRYSYSYAPGGTVLNASQLFLGTQPYTNAYNIPYLQNGQFTAEAISIVTTWEPGVIASATWKQGANSLTFGAWIDNAAVTVRNPFLPVDVGGGAKAIADANFVKVGNGQTLYAATWNANRQTTALFLSDEWRGFDDRLKIMAGLKALVVGVTGNLTIFQARSQLSNPYSNTFSRLDLAKYLRRQSSWPDLL